MAEAVPGAPQKKTFKRTHTQLPVLRSYKGDLPNSYWANWTKRSYEELKENKSWISPTRLLEIAQEVGYTGYEKNLLRTIDRLTMVQKLGARGMGDYQLRC